MPSEPRKTTYSIIMDWPYDEASDVAASFSDPDEANRFMEETGKLEPKRFQYRLQSVVEDAAVGFVAKMVYGVTLYGKRTFAFAELKRNDYCDKVMTDPDIPVYAEDGIDSKILYIVGSSFDSYGEAFDRAKEKWESLV